MLHELTNINMQNNFNSIIFVMNLKYQGNVMQKVIKLCIRTVFLTNDN